MGGPGPWRSARDVPDPAPSGPDSATPVRAIGGLRRGRLLSRLPSLLGPLTLVFCALMLWDRVEPGLIADVHTALGAVGWSSWAIAVPATALSLWAVGQYDGLMHRALQTGVPAARARSAGRRAIASARAEAAGLRQFKDSFGVRWQPLYAAAPTLPALVKGLAAVAWAVRHPGPLPPAPDFAFDLRPRPCDAPHQSRDTQPRQPQPE